VIDWIESFNCREYRPDDNDEIIELCNAYRRKEWLLCLKNNNERADKLYQEYHLINDAKVEHPGFSYWSSGVHAIAKYSYSNQTELCNNPIKVITNFNPSEIENKSIFDSDEDLKSGLANDLSTCIKNDPTTFANTIDDFKDLEYIYKNKVIQGLANAWNDKQVFDWEKVLDFIENELTPNFFSSDENHKQWFVLEIANLIKCGTREDNNAFNEGLLPKAKKILLNLLNNKYEEEYQMSSNMGNHILNSTNGKVLHALINYTLRCGRLKSSQSVKWEKEVKDFFTQQLEDNNIYSRSVFTVLGFYFHHLQFLDKKWTIDNFNKIFPLEKKQLWKDSIQEYILCTNTVNEETYRLFKNKGHIKEILRTDFQANQTKSRLISFVCIAYINDIDNDTIFDIINSKDTNNILGIIRSIFQVYGGTENKGEKDKIKIIWNKIDETCQSTDVEDVEDIQKIFNALCDWFVFLDEILDEDIKLLKHTVGRAKDDYQNLLTEMARLSSEYAQGINELYKHMIDNNIYPTTYRTEDIKQILDNLDDNDALKIRNSYHAKGMYRIAEL